MIRRILVAAVFVVFMLLAPSTSEAACTIETTGVAFGSYNVFNAAPVDSTGTITYRCGIIEALFRTITITLSTGQSGTFSARAMRKGTESLTYNLYRDASFTQVWGNQSGGTVIYSARPPYNTDVDLTVYGRVPAGQDVSSGVYSDTIVATINF